MKKIFDKTSFDCSVSVTKNYSTSFSIAIKLLGKEIQPSIYSIYGFVRLADEIVDTFHDFNQEKLMDELILEYENALSNKISLNPIINSFQQIVHQFKLYDLVDSFLKSMKMDLVKKEYETIQEYEEYIYGSADVVGLMCLKVFVNGDEKRYNELKESAMKLGSAFQKVNFLRDLNYDYQELGRVYFPNINLQNLTESDKIRLIEEIKYDFDEAYKGIKALPANAKIGVLIAYKYYLKLLRKIEKTESSKLLQTRISVPNFEKFSILFRTFIFSKLQLR